MEKFQIFEHEQFGKVRAVIIDADPWFVGNDVAIVLGYANPRAALSKHVPSKFKRESRIATPYGVQNMVIVSEPGLYRLIMRSNMPKAEDFTDWVCGEVLPSIRKTGKYSLVAKREPNPRRVAGQFTDACVYVALMSDGTVKIGQSHDVNKRLSNLKSQYKLSVEKIHSTPFMSRKVARLIEQACHKIFSSSKVDGEFFSAKFEAACATVDSFVEVIATLTESKISVMSAKLIAAEKFA